MPSISVIIPTYNHAKYLNRALNSVKNQTYTDWEAIIIDNYSNDETEDIVKTFLLDKRFKYVKIYNNGIIAKSRNHGILLAKSKWISFLDSDDWWDLNKLKIASRYLKDNFDVIYHPLEIKKNKNISLIKNLISNKNIKTSIHYKLLFYGNLIANSSVIINKSIIYKVNFINENKCMVGAEDYNLLLKISKISNKFHFINNKLGYYELHQDGVSRKNMSHCHFFAIYEFLNDLKRAKKNKIILNIVYIKASFHKNNNNYKLALKYAKICLFNFHFKFYFKTLYIILYCLFKELYSKISKKIE